MAKSNELGMLRKRGAIAREIIKDSVSEKNKTIKKLKTNLNKLRNIFSEDPQHKETIHINKCYLNLKIN